MADESRPIDPDPDPDRADPADGPPPVLRRSDMALLRKAGRGRWNVPDEARSEAIWQLWRIVQDPRSTARAKLAAVRTLAMIDRTDQADDRLDLSRSRQARPPEGDARPEFHIPDHDDRHEDEPGPPAPPG